MTQSTRMSSSERKRNSTQGFKHDLRSRILTFIDTANRGVLDIDRELSLAQDIGNFMGAEAFVNHARAMIDIAYRHGEALGSEAINIIAEAGLIAKKAAFEGTGRAKLEAGRVMRHIPLHISLSEGKIPTIDKLSEVHEKSLSAIPETIEIWNKVKNGDRQTTAGVKGYMSEEATRLLLSRYAITNDLDGYVPVTSRLSEDASRLVHGHLHTGWDISIYTDLGDTRHPAHKLQVKTSHDGDNKIYDDSCGVDLIFVSDLYPDQYNGRRVHPMSVLQELTAEHGHKDDTRNSNRLDYRTDILLDMFN